MSSSIACPPPHGLRQCPPQGCKSEKSTIHLYTHVSLGCVAGSRHVDWERDKVRLLTLFRIRWSCYEEGG